MYRFLFLGDIVIGKNRKQQKVNLVGFLFAAFSCVKLFFQCRLGLTHKVGFLGHENKTKNVSFVDKLGKSGDFNYGKDACQKEYILPSYEEIFLSPLNQGELQGHLKLGENLKAPERLFGLVFSRIKKSKCFYENNNAKHFKGKYKFGLLVLLLFLGSFFWYSKTLKLANRKPFKLEKTVKNRASNFSNPSPKWVYFWK